MRSQGWRGSLWERSRGDRPAPYGNQRPRTRRLPAASRHLLSEPGGGAAAGDGPPLKNKSYTWAGAENFRRHMLGYRSAQHISAAYGKPGDLVLFKRKKERGYNHVAIVERNRHGLQLIQHGSSNRTSLAAATTRYRGKANYIERVIVLRPKARELTMVCKARLSGIAVAAAVLGGLMAGCASGESDGYQTDYTSHQPLHVVGYPSTGSLETVQKAVWRLADGDAEGLAELGVDDKDADATARNWVTSFGAAAKGEVTADFYDEGSVRQVVVLYFAKTGQVKEIEARIGEDDAWGITLAEPNPAEASARPSWAPAKPGTTGSRSSGAQSAR